ncbi:MAG: NAD(P)/FAD-dependent oxidoreductase [Pseudomonadota bacterium]
MTDVIVIGAGHNGLSCAAYLARAGKQVLCLEASASVGGMSAPHQFGDHYTLPGLPVSSYPLSKNIRKELQLNKFGYQAGKAIDTHVLDKAGNHLSIRGEQVEGANLSESDRQAFPEFIQRYHFFAKALQPFFDRQPPRLIDMDRLDKKTLLRLGWNLRVGLGRDAMYEFLRVAAINIYDVLNDTFEHELLKSYLANEAIMGSAMGPRTPGSVLSWLHRLQGALNGPRGHFTNAESGLIQALQASAEDAGVTIQCNSRVKQLLIEDDRAVGVELENGSTIHAELVVSSADPRNTFLQLVGAGKLDAMFANRIEQIRGNGVVAKLHLALNGLPAVPGLDTQELNGRFLIAPSMRHIERAFNHAKYGEYSEQAVIEFTLPTAVQADLAPNGQHILSANVAYAPHDLAGGWAQHKEQFTEQLITQLDEVMPGLASQVVARELLTPADIESRYSVMQGHWHHAELSIHQSMMMRPVYGAAQYSTPIDNLYLCGAGCHPGGDLNSLAGHNAAKRILQSGAFK